MVWLKGSLASNVWMDFWKGNNYMILYYSVRIRNDNHFHPCDRHDHILSILNGLIGNYFSPLGFLYFISFLSKCIIQWSFSQCILGCSLPFDTWYCKKWNNVFYSVAIQWIVFYCANNVQSYFFRKRGISIWSSKSSFG